MNKELEATIKAYWKRWTYAPHYYQVNIVTNGVYEGVGAFCDTYEDMVAFCKEHNATEIIERED